MRSLPPRSAGCDVASHGTAPRRATKPCSRPRRSRSSRDLARTFAPRVDELLARRASARPSSTRASSSTSCPRRPTSATATGRSRRCPTDLLDRRVEITGPGRPQDDHQRAQLRRAASSWPTSRTPTAPTWDNLVAGPDQPRATRSAGTIAYTAPETGKKYALNDETAVAARAAARLAPRRAARDASTASPSPAALFDFGLFFFHNAQGAARARAPARTSTCPSWRATSRRGSGTTSSSARRRRSASRTAPSRRRCSSRRCPPRSRWTRSSTSCASTRRASTAAAGTTSSASSRSARATPRAVLPDRAQVTMDKALPARLLAAAHQDLPPPRRARDGRHGGADPDQGRPRGQRGRAREGARRQAARGEGRPRRHLGRAPGPRARSRKRDLRRAHAGPEPARRASATT